MRRALEEIEARLGDPSLHVEDLAGRQGVGRRYLDGVFREQLGVTAAEHIRARRLDCAARDLLVSPGLHAAEVASRYGFRTASHFGRAFRRQHGHAPSAYRRAVERAPGA